MGKVKDEDITFAEAAQATTWSPGLVLDRFTLVGKIATGGMADIWLARQAGPRGFEKMVVIKRILDSYGRDESFIEMFLDEARIAALLTHPNIVQIYDLGEFERAYFIAMEFVAGEHLARIAKASVRLGKLMPFPIAARVVAEAAHGLHYAHTKASNDGKPLNIVHRDVSPQNVMITYDGLVKVLDFGVAKAANRSTHTEAGKFKGKIAYMAPEVARAEPFDARADVFSLGIILYELLARCRLFDFEDPVEGVLAVSAKTPLPSVKVKNPEVPHELAAIAAKALERDRGARYATARELATALEDWLRVQPDPPEPAAIGRYMQALFAERIKKQNALLAAVRQSPSGVIPMRATPTGEISMPGSRTGSARKRWVPIGALVLACAAVLGGVLLASRPDEDAAVAPPPLPAVLVIESDPPGAQVQLDGRGVGPAPITLSDVGLGTHRVRALAPGHAPTERTVNLERPGERTNLLLALKALGAASPADAGAGPAASTGQVAKASRGRLNLIAVPWAEVYLGSRRLGETPLVEFPLPAGKHTLRLYNPDRKIERSVTVEIRPGQTTSLKHKL